MGARGAAPLQGGTSEGTPPLQLKQRCKKSERPVGVPAALAWGMEGLQVESSILFRRGRLFHCARQQKNNTQEQDRDDHPPTLEEPNSRLRE